jgi:serine/threonine protein phosphatase PrpC
MSITLDCHGLTDPGRERPNNEDQFLIADLAKTMTVLGSSLPHNDHARLFGHRHGTLLLVADGMGGHAGGEKAIGVAVRTLADYVLNMMPWFFRSQDGEEVSLEDDLKTALEECQRRVVAADNNGGKRKMGTTLTMAYVLWPRL